MALISIANLRYSYGDHHVLDGVNLTLADGEHVGLVGRNGCGKSTLLKLIRAVSVGEPTKHDDGQIQVARNATVGYLDQHHDLDPAKTLREEALGAFADLHALHDQLEQTAHAMGDAGDDPDELDRLMKRYADLEHRIDAAGGFVVEHKVEGTLHGLGLTDEFFDVMCGDLSGGQRGRLALARLLLAQPDVLLLDEPTNHLDIAGRQWLEEFLKGYGGAVLLISHDRWLLDHVVSKIYELEEGELVEYPGNYAKFRELRAARIEEMRRAYGKQQTRIKSEQAFIDRYKAGQRAKQARGRESRLERFKRDHLIELPPELDAMKLSFAPKQRSGDVVLAAEQLTKGYEGKPLFDDVTVTLKRGERLGVIGPNGAGKSTIVRCLLGEQEADAGTAKLGASLNVGFYRQSHDGLDLALTVVEYLRRLVPSGTEQEARDLAGAFLLSGGERSRAVLAGLMVNGHNLLVLDEPTNHLDIPSAERLEESLRRYTSLTKKYSTTGQGGTEGTLILISHDRMLLDALVDQLLVFDGHGHASLFQGNYSAWLADHAKQAAAAAEAQATKEARAAKQAAKPAPKAAPPPQREEPAKRKQPAGPPRKGVASKMSRDKLDARIAELTKSIQQHDFDLMNPDIFRDGEKVKRLQQQRTAMQDELSTLEEEWLAREA